MLINFRENFIFRIFIISVTITLLCQSFIFGQRSNNTTGNKTKSNTFNKYLLSDPKPFMPGDGLLINTFPDTSSFLNKIFPIDDLGFVDFPIAGKVNVSEMNTDELISFLKQNFQQYIRTPNVSIKPMMRISLIGGFLNPGLYYVDHSTSMWEAVRIGGGLTQESGLEEMAWERDGDEVVDDIVPYFEKGVSLKNMGFKSGDQLVTPTIAPMNWRESLQFIMGLATFTTGLYMTYLTYQTQIQILQQGRR